MTVAVQMPGRPRNKTQELLNTILTGLTIAEKVYGLSQAGDEAERLRKSQEHTQKVRDQQQADKFAATFAPHPADQGGIKIPGRDGTFLPREDVRSQATTQRLTTEKETAAAKDARKERLGILEKFAIVDEGTEGAAQAQIPTADGSGFETAFLAPRKTLESRAKQAEQGEIATDIKGVQKKVTALQGESRKRFNNNTMGLSGIRGMRSALINDGQNTFTLKGDNDFTLQRKLFVDAISRLQSGAALTDKEIQQYTSLVPTVWDSTEMQKTKLNQLESIFRNRVRAFGVDPNAAIEYIALDEQNHMNLAPHGNVVEQNGVRYHWNGAGYVPAQSPEEVIGNVGIRPPEAL